MKIFYNIAYILSKHFTQNKSLDWSELHYKPVDLCVSVYMCGDICRCFPLIYSISKRLRINV